ncbi:MAG: hypothetical protein ABIZ49_07950 [Opitutaceae bacterium]
MVYPLDRLWGAIAIPTLLRMTKEFGGRMTAFAGVVFDSTFCKRAEEEWRTAANVGEIAEALASKKSIRGEVLFAGGSGP